MSLDSKYAALLFNFSVDLLCVANLDGYFTHINHSFTKVLGYTEKELLEKPFCDFVHPDDAEGTRIETVSLSQGKPTLQFRNRYRCKNNSYRWLEWNATPIIEENIILAVARDITLQVETEQQLKSAVKNIKDLQTAIDESALVSITDATGKIIYANDQFIRISKYNEEELIGQNHRIVKSHYHSKSFFEEMWKTISRGNIWKGEIYNCDKNGEPYWVSSTIIPVLNSGNKPEKYISIRFDITERKKIEESYARTISQLDGVLNGATQCLIIAIDLNGLIIIFNSGAEQILGYTADEMVGKQPIGIIHKLEELEEYRKEASLKFGRKMKILEIFNENSKSRNYEEREWTYVKKDGSTLPVNLISTTLRDKNDNPIGYVGVGIDISEKKKVEKYQNMYFEITKVLEESVFLRESSLKLLQIICKSLAWHAASIWILNTEKTCLDCLDFYSDSNIKINTFELQTRSITFTLGVGLPGRIWASRCSEWISDVTVDKNFPRALAAIQDHIYTGVGFPLKVGDKVLGVIEFFNTSVLPPDNHLIKILEDIGSRIGQFILRKQTEQLVKNNEQKLQTLTNIVPIGIYLTDENGSCTYTNQHWQTLTGLTLEESLGQGWTKAINADEAPIVFNEWAAAIAEHRDFKLEFHYTTPDGWLTPIFSRATPFYNTNGSMAGFVGISEDITERKLVESEIAAVRDAALETARIKSEFLANMSHEIRTPMNGIIGMISLLVETELSQEQMEQVKIIQRSSESLLTIINDILDFSKIEAGKLELENTDFNLREMVEDVIQLLSPNANNKGVELIYLFSEKVPNWVKSDSIRIKQTLTNLVSNAIKFTEKGKIIIRISCLKSDRGISQVHFAVKDTGIGIEEEVQSKLFTAFNQADASTTRRFGGTGLGLAICKKIVELMGGEIGIKSEIDKGSTFYFTLPLETAEASTSVFFPSEKYKNLRILIVDDNDVNQEVLTLFLASWGIKNNEAVFSAMEALKKLEESYQVGNPFSFILTDLMMPNMDGLKLVEIIRSNVLYNNTKIIILSSAWTQYQEQAMKSGADAYITKPIRQQQLKQCIDSLINSQDVIPSKPLRIFTPIAIELVTNGHLLVVEDNEVNQKVIFGMIKKLGYTCDCAQNGKEGVEKIVEKDYAAILMDCQMPIMDGFEATRIIRQQEQYKNIPIIGITANALQGDREKVLEAGMNDYLPKPITTKSLEEMLEKWLKDKKDKEIELQPSTASLAQIQNFAEFLTLDGSALESIAELQMEGEVDVVKDIIHSYLLQLPEDLESLDQAMVSNNFKKLGQVAHAIKGGSRAIGAMRVGEICAVLEKIAGQNDLGQSIELIKQLKIECLSTKEALKKYTTC